MKLCASIALPLQSPETLCAIFELTDTNSKTKENMKKVLTLTFLIILTSYCKSQSNGFSLIGKWVCVEEHGSNGAREFISKIKDGDILVFASANTVTDKRGVKGLYNLNGDSLHIAIPNNERFYILQKFKDDFEKISLVPVTSEYKVICDEGCSFIYKKVN